MRILKGLVALAYVVLLTVMLLTPDPAALMRLKEFDWILVYDFFIHFTAFVILAIIIHAQRWPRPVHWLFLVVLAAYGITTESLQYFVPGRSVELKDYTANLLGIAIGSGIYGLLRRKWKSLLAIVGN